MRLVVDEMPESKNKCPYSKWTPYPPFVEEPGFYKCGFSGKGCSLGKDSCKHLVALKISEE